MSPAARALLPYALAAVLVVAVSLVALVASLEAGPGAAGGVAFPTDSAGATAGIELADDLRVAYWRDEPNGETVLWAANVDGHRRYALHTAADRFRIGETRWAGDGSAVSYIERDVEIVVLPLGGARYDVGMPVALEPRLREILDHNWSADGRWIAATLWDLDGGTDVYVVQPESGAWRRLTSFGDAFVGVWLDERELLIQTQRGLLAAVEVEAPSAIRPFTGAPATSPLVGSDGRVHFLIGQFVFEDQLSGYPAASGAVPHSATADGGDLRAEGSVEHDQVRLLGIWPPSGAESAGDPCSPSRPCRYLAGNVRPSILGTADGARHPIPGGPYDRAIALPDGRHALVLERGRLSLLDVAAAERRPRPPSAATVLLDGVRDVAAWWPRVQVRRGDVAPGDESVPPFRSAGLLGGQLWVEEPGKGWRLLAVGDESGAVQQAAWLGDGRLLALAGRLGTTAASPVLVDPATGAIEEGLPEIPSTYMSVRPDGRAIALSDGQTVIRTFALDGRELAEIEGREAAWSAAGLFWIDAGRSSFGTLGRFGHSLWAELEGERRVVASGGDLLRQIPHAGGSDDLAGRTQLWDLVASPGGEYVAVMVFDAPWRGLTRVIVRVSDGVVVETFPDGSSRPSWSPDGAALGITVLSREQPPLAVLMRGDGRRFAEIPGTFAGWTPDGEWFLVAGPEGLFAHPIDLPGRRHFLSPIGVPVVTTAP